MKRLTSVDRSLREAVIRELFIGALNDGKKTEDWPAALQVFDLCRKLAELRQNENQSRSAASIEQLPSNLTEQASIVNAVNKLLRQFHFFPMLSPESEIYWMAQRRPHDEPGTVTATALVQVVLEMTRDGSLERVRKCLCGRWFLANTNKKVVCSDSCRFKKFKQGKEEKFNKDRAAYMRGYRKNPIVKRRKRSDAKRKK